VRSSARADPLEIYLAGAPDELRRGLVRLGKRGENGRISLRGAMAMVGPQGAVVTVSPGVSEKEARLLFDGLVEQARERHWTLSTGGGAPLPLDTRDLLALLRSTEAAALAEEDAKPSKELNPQQRKLVFLMVVVVVGLIGIVVLRLILKAFLHDRFGTLD
jgi:hypothetical protein